MDLSRELETKGFAIVPDILAPGDLRIYQDAVDEALKNDSSRDRVPGLRNVLETVQVAREFAICPQLCQLIEPILGVKYFAVRALIFDKTAETNWKVPFHQDLTIAVENKNEMAGFAAWSTKAGVLHVQPPVNILEKMLTVRLHFDDCDESNGALRVLAGSHLLGKLSAVKIQGLRQTQEEKICVVPAGGVLLMRPLLLHASSLATTPRRRRVLHLELAREELPCGLKWRWRVPEYS